jgi:phosphate transport system substrate-binding protein
MPGNNTWVRFAISVIACLCTATASAGEDPVVSRGRLVLQGSTTFNTTVVEKFGKAVESETGLKLVVIPNKSSLGLLALLADNASLAMLSTGLENEVEQLREANPELPFERLRSFEIARTRAAFVVHPSNPVRNLPLDQVRGILTGEITNWKELGGPDLKIIVVAVRQGGGVLASVESRLLGKGHISAPDTIRLPVGTQIVTVVGQEPGAFGITQLSVVKASHAAELVTDAPIEQILSLVSLDAPSAEAVTLIDAMRRKFAAPE